MTELVVRRLLIDLKRPIARHWLDNDPFRSAWFNALSMSFPIGEQLFIDSVRQGSAELDDAQRARWGPVLQAFIAQEATHRHIHSLFNNHLARLGYENAWAQRIAQRTARMDELDSMVAVAVTAATEHFTTLFADWLLGHREVLDGCEERIRTLWFWHSSEELEHRAVAFDLLRAMGGNSRLRIQWYLITTILFVTDVFRQTIHNLRHDGELFRWRTLASALTFLFGKRGVVRSTFGPWVRYLAPGFHPMHAQYPAGDTWLRANREKFTEHRNVAG